MNISYKKNSILCHEFLHLLSNPQIDVKYHIPIFFKDRLLHPLLMVIRVVEFSSQGYRIRKIFAERSTYPRKLLNFENWCGGEVSKSAKVWLSKSIFYVKNHRNLSHFFFIQKCQFTSTFVLSIFKPLHYQNDVQLLKVCNYTNSQNSIISLGYVNF